MAWQAFTMIQKIRRVVLRGVLEKGQGSEESIKLKRVARPTLIKDCGIVAKFSPFILHLYSTNDVTIQADQST